MSEEKLYVVKNDEGKYLYMESTPCWDNEAGTAIKSRNLALGWAKNNGGHVVTFVEEPKKVVLTKEQAEIVKGAHDATWPARWIDDKADDIKHEEELLMNAYVNGYTVAKKKRYLLPMEGFGEHQGYSYMEDGIWYINTAPTQDYADKHGYTVTKDEYDSAPNWVKVLKPVEVTDDGIR